MGGCWRLARYRLARPQCEPLSVLLRLPYYSDNRFPHPQAPDKSPYCARLNNLSRPPKGSLSRGQTVPTG